MRTHLLLAALLAAPAAPAAPAPGKTPIIRTSEVKPGMKGYGKTVFKGDQVENFDVEVVDVLRHAIFPKRDLILVRCSGHDLEKTKVIAGMSGSPVYLDGRLAGAVAYGWAFSNEALAGVTPIDWMLEEGERPVEFPEGFFGAASAPSLPLVPSRTPLMAAGFGPPVLEKFRPFFEKYNMEFVPAGGAGGLDERAPKTLEPGSAVGVQLVRGDWDLAGIGTVTHVDGARVVAFGHPMFGFGEITAPLCTAWVNGVFSGAARSFKFAASGPAVGRLTQDRAPCIAGEIGKEAPMIPVRVSVRNERTGGVERFEAEVMKHRLLSPLLAFLCMEEALFVSNFQFGDNVLTWSLAIEIEGRSEPLLLSDLAYSEFAPDIMGLFFTVGGLSMNPHGPVRLRRIEADLSVRHAKDAAAVEYLRLPRREVRRGETLEVAVGLRRRHAKEVEERTLSVAVPERFPPGPLRIRVSAGSRTPPDRARPNSVDDLVAYLSELHRADQLVMTLTAPTTGVELRGRKLPSLPASVISALTPPDAPARVAAVPDTVRKVFPLKGLVLAGEETATVEVKERP